MSQSTSPIETLLESYRADRSSPGASEKLATALLAEMKEILKAPSFTSRYRKAVLEEVPAKVFEEWTTKGEILPTWQPGGTATLRTYLTTILKNRAIDLSKPEWSEPVDGFSEDDSEEGPLHRDKRKTHSSLLRVAQLETRFRHLLAEIPGAVLIDAGGKRTKLKETHRQLLEYALQCVDESPSGQPRLPSQKEMAEALGEPEKSVGRWWREIQAYLATRPDADLLKAMLVPVGRHSR